MQNRAEEMLMEAYRLAGYYSNREQVKTLLRLALAEVRELQAQVAHYEQPAPAMIQAQLVESQRPFAQTGA